MSLLDIHLVNPSLGSVIHSTSNGGKVHLFSYPCDSHLVCTPYSVTFPPGVFRIEAWGAQGGSGRFPSGKGSYVSGDISFSKQTTLFMFLGGSGGRGINGTYNGGGTWVTNNSLPGGGATDIRLSPEESFEGLKSRIIVSAGGGGSVIHGMVGYPAGSGGGIFGTIGGITNNTNCTTTKQIHHPIPANQTNGGFTPNFSWNKAGGFGKGGSIINGYAGTGGGGYYGGSAGNQVDCLVSTGGGGSSFISGHNGCDAISKVSTVNIIKHTGCSLHYSGYQFTSTEMKNGTEVFSKPQGGTETGHEGNGFVRITVLISKSMIKTCKRAFFRPVFL